MRRSSARCCFRVRCACSETGTGTCPAGSPGFQGYGSKVRRPTRARHTCSRVEWWIAPPRRSNLAVTSRLVRRSEVARGTGSSSAGRGAGVSARPGSPHRRLAALIGRWRTQGRTLDTPAASIEAVDTYEWLPGGRALLHVVDAQVGDEQVKGAEIIGWDS